MSTDLHKTMLFYKGRTVIAKSKGVQVELDVLPLIDALPSNTTEIHFYPALCEYRLRENAKPVREMHAPEIEAVLGFLRRVADFGCGLLSRQP